MNINSTGATYGFKPFSSRKTAPFSNNLGDIRKELRQRRKSFISSYCSLKEIITIDDKISDELIEQFSRYLAKRASLLWINKPPEAEGFCYRFFVLAIHALVFEQVSGECIDDIIQLAECLVRSKETFVMVGKQLLSPDWEEELHNFTEEYYREFYVPYFSDAVLGAVSVYTGALEDPVKDEKRG